MDAGLIEQGGFAIRKKPEIGQLHGRRVLELGCGGWGAVRVGVRRALLEPTLGACWG